VHLVPTETGSRLPPFEAGAHVDLHFPNNLVRQYSIASSPLQLDHYLLCIRREASSRGGSAYVHEQLRVGQSLTISAPRNLFALRPHAPAVLLAGGIGITPLLSMALALDAEGQSFELHYYVRHRHEVAFSRLLNHGFRHGTVYLHCSAEGDSLRAGLPVCLHTPDRQTHIYVCGPQGFMAEVRQRTSAQGWCAEQIH